MTLRDRNFPDVKAAASLVQLQIVIRDLSNFYQRPLIGIMFDC